MAEKFKKVLVTGSTSGIGLEISKQLLDQGFFVIFHGRGQDLTEFETLKNKYPHQVDHFWFDLSQDPKDSIQELFKKQGPLWGLVNNAGVMAKESVWECSYESLMDLFKINTFSSFILSREFMKVVDPDRGGRIINISSNVVKFGMGRNSSIQYAATKSALEVLTVGLSRLGAKKNILVNAVRPGCILTRLQENREDFEDRVRLIPVGRMGEKEEVSSLVEYLISEKSSFITGQVIGVSGGE